MDLYQELHKEIMKLSQDDVTCDCEKVTNSDSGKNNSNCSTDVVKWLKKNEQHCDIFDIDIEQVEERYNNCINGTGDCPISEENCKN